MLAQRCRATAVSGRGACWRYNICFTGCVPHATVTMPLQPHEAEQGIKSRAAQVAEPAEWIGFFEWFVIARLYKVRILLVFGNNVFDVHGVFGQGFPAYEPTATWYVVAVKLDGTATPKSGVKPDSCQLDVNHFMIGVPILNGCSGTPHLAIDLEKDISYKGSKRQSANAACQELNLSVRDTQAYDECGIDTVAFH